MKIGIYGGTFNPPHNTHVRIAQAAKQQLGLDKLIAVPGGMPPHKFCAVDKQTRFEMSRLAFGDFAEVSDVELNREGKTYTLDTVKHFSQMYPDDQLFFIVGGDSLQQFDTWHCPQQILNYVTLAVAARQHDLTKSDEESFVLRYGCIYQTIDVVPDNVSSSEIRLMYRFGLPVSTVPTAVDKYVRDKGLYSQYSTLVDKLKTYLPQKRFMHTFYVVKRGLELCTAEEQKQVFLACLLHDCAKYMLADKYAEYGFDKPDDMPENVVHAFLGALVAKQDFGVNDEEILHAIKYHCTACSDMNRLDKIVYVADKTEETRPYPLQHLLCGTLDDMFVNCLVEANEYCLTKHTDSVYYLTLQALQRYASNKCNG